MFNVFIFVTACIKVRQESVNGGNILPFFCSPRAAERETAAMSSSMMFYAGMEKERGQGEEEKKCFFALCMYLYLVCSVQIYLSKHSYSNCGSRKEKKKRGESQKNGFY